MKMNKYSVSIIAGILFGLLIALLFGNCLTSVLSGTIVAFATTWVMSLNWSWSSIKKIINIFPVINFDFIEKTGITAKNNIVILGKKLKLIFQQIKKPAEWRILICGLVLVLLAVFLLLIYCKSLLVLGSYYGLYLPLVMFWFLVEGMCTWLGIYYGSTLIKVGIFGSSPNDKSLYFSSFQNWYLSIYYDNRRTLLSIIYMLFIRTVNALKLLICIIPMFFIFLVWAFVKLSTIKTYGCAFCSGILMAIHLTVCYRYEWIDFANINFWQLALIITIVGWLTGKYLIQKEVEFKFPKIHWLEHLPAKA